MVGLKEWLNTAISYQPLAFSHAECRSPWAILTSELRPYLVRASAMRNPVAIAPGSDNATDRPLTQAVLTFDALGNVRLLLALLLD